MPGPTPKPAATRQRRNRTSTTARFETDERPIEGIPDLGIHPVAEEEWHARTKAWWAEVWDSPMADEYLKADVDGLLQLATLIDGFWKKPNAAVSAEIRLQRQCFGLTPIDRRRLQWEIVRVEAATKKAKPPTPPQVGDPRSVLKAVS